MPAHRASHGIGPKRKRDLEGRKKLAHGIAVAPCQRIPIQEAGGFSYTSSGGGASPIARQAANRCVLVLWRKARRAIDVSPRRKPWEIGKTEKSPRRGRQIPARHRDPRPRNFKCLWTTASARVRTPLPRHAAAFNPPRVRFSPRESAGGQGGHLSDMPMQPCSQNAYDNCREGRFTGGIPNFRYRDFGPEIPEPGHFPRAPDPRTTAEMTGRTKSTPCRHAGRDRADERTSRADSPL